MVPLKLPLFLAQYGRPQPQMQPYLQNDPWLEQEHARERRHWERGQLWFHRNERREGGSEENSVTRDAAKEVLSCQYLAGSPIEINLSKGPLILVYWEHVHYLQTSHISLKPLALQHCGVEWINWHGQKCIHRMKRGDFLSRFSSETASAAVAS